MNEDHYGLEDVKDRILEFLAVRKLRLERKEEMAQDVNTDHIRREREGVILCFHRSTGGWKNLSWANLSPARLGENLSASLWAECATKPKSAGTAEPISARCQAASSKRCAGRNRAIRYLCWMKWTNSASDFRGDPASALLEVLDPEQNIDFRDNYIEVGFNLSQVMFITTANTIETIPTPLLDRMEVIRISGYTEGEKVEIARNYLVPRQLRENGLRVE